MKGSTQFDFAATPRPCPHFPTGTSAQTSRTLPKKPLHPKYPQAPHNPLIRIAPRDHFAHPGACRQQANPFAGIDPIASTKLKAEAAATACSGTPRVCRSPSAPNKYLDQRPNPAFPPAKLRSRRTTMSGKSNPGFQTRPNSVRPPHSTPMNPKTAQEACSSKNCTSNRPHSPSQLTETKQPNIGSNLGSNPRRTPFKPRANPERTPSEPHSDPNRTVRTPVPALSLKTAAGPQTSSSQPFFPALIPIVRPNVALRPAASWICPQKNHSGCTRSMNDAIAVDPKCKPGPASSSAQPLGGQWHTRISGSSPANGSRRSASSDSDDSPGVSKGVGFE
jgi:hypothetical protein